MEAIIEKKLRGDIRAKALQIAFLLNTDDEDLRGTIVDGATLIGRVCQIEAEMRHEVDQLAKDVPLSQGGVCTAQTHNKIGFNTKKKEEPTSASK